MNAPARIQRTPDGKHVGWKVRWHDHWKHYSATGDNIYRSHAEADAAFRSMRKSKRFEPLDIVRVSTRFDDATCFEDIGWAEYWAEPEVTATQVRAA